MSSAFGFSDPDLSGNRSMLMAKGKAVIHLGMLPRTYYHCAASSLKVKVSSVPVLPSREMR